MADRGTRYTTDADAAGCDTIPAMEINQIKRFIKDLEERTDSLRRYL
jgi:hypothetical protein